TTRIVFVRIASPLSGRYSTRRPWNRRFAALLSHARSGQKMDDVEVVFVARVLVHLLARIDLGPRNPGGPWPRPRRRILDRELVAQRVRVHASETPGDLVGRRV